MTDILSNIRAVINDMSLNRSYNKNELIRIKEYKEIIYQDDNDFNILSELRGHISVNLHKESKFILRKHNGHKQITKPLVSLSTLSEMKRACYVEQKIISQSIYLDLRIALNDMMKNDLQEE